LRAIPTSEPGKSQWEAPNIRIAPDHPSRISLKKRWNFAETTHNGPFGIRPVWRGRSSGQKSTLRPLELHRWNAQTTPKLSLSFWLHPGARENIQATINCLDETGEILTHLILKSSTGGHISRGGWQEVVFHQEDHAIPK
jgi:hypothetical protein